MAAEYATRSPDDASRAPHLVGLRHSLGTARLSHLLTSELDAAADWYEQMIEERDPFALLYARTPTLGPLRDHHRWPHLAALMKLPVVATPPWLMP